MGRPSPQAAGPPYAQFMHRRESLAAEECLTQWESLEAGTGMSTTAHSPVTPQHSAWERHMAIAAVG